MLGRALIPELYEGAREALDGRERGVRELKERLVARGADAALRTGGATDRLRAVGVARGLLYRGEDCRAGRVARDGATRDEEADLPPPRLADWASTSAEAPRSARVMAPITVPMNLVVFDIGLPPGTANWFSARQTSRR